MICDNCIHKDVCADNDNETQRDYCTWFEEERPQGKWGKWVISEVRCPECLEYFDTGCFSKEEMNNCPNCGAKMEVTSE